MNDIRPRTLAADILRRPLPERAAAVAAIDGDALRSTVQFYVTDHEQRIKNLVAWVSLGQTRAERGRRLETVPAAKREEVQMRVEALFKQRAGAK